MNSLILSGCFALGVILLALWVVTVVNRAPPPARLTLVRYAGRDFSAFTKAWKRMLNRAFA